MNVTQQTKPWGNSTGIRLSQKVLKQARWQPNQHVSIDIQGRSIVLKPVKEVTTAELTIDELVAGITSENVHGAVDWGEPVGNEIW